MRLALLLLLTCSVELYAQVDISAKPLIELFPDTRETASITVKGTFTPKAPVVLFDQADIAFEAGVANTVLSAISIDKGLTKNEFMHSLNAAWGNSSDSLFYIKRDPAHQRYPKAGGYYFVEDNEAHLQQPRIQSKDKVWPNPATEPKKLYVSWWLKQQNDTRDYFTFTLTDVSADFNPQEGDEFFIDVSPQRAGVPNEVLGRVINYNKTTKAFAANFYGQSNINKLKSVPPRVLKLNKGGSAALGEAIGGQGANKYIRIWEADGTEGAMRLSWTNTQVSMGNLQSYNRSNVVPRHWNHMEIFVDQINKTIETRVNGVSDFKGTYTDEADRAGFAPSIGLIGFDTNQEMFQRIWMDDIYMDTSFRRVTLGNADKRSAVTHEEVQYVDSWTATQIKFKPNYGSLSRLTPAYIYVYDENGVPNEKGIPFESPVSWGTSSVASSAK